MRASFTAPSIPALFREILEAEPDLGCLQGPLRELVAQCLAKHPAQRPTAGELVNRLTGITGHPSTEPALGSASPAVVPEPRGRRKWGIPFAAVGGVAVLVAVSVFLLLDAQGSNPIEADLVDNGGFEKTLSPSWSSRGAARVSAARHSGSYAVRLQSVPGQDAAVEQQIKGLRANHRLHIDRLGAVRRHAD